MHGSSSVSIVHNLTCRKIRKWKKCTEESNDFLFLRVAFLCCIPRTILYAEMPVSFLKERKGRESLEGGYPECK